MEILAMWQTLSGTCILGPLRALSSMVSQEWGCGGCRARKSIEGAGRLADACFRIAGATLMITHVIVTYALGLSVSLFSIFVVVVGFTLAFSEEKYRRAQFMLEHFPNEILTHLNGKTLERQQSMMSLGGYRTQGWIEGEGRDKEESRSVSREGVRLSLREVEEGEGAPAMQQTAEEPPTHNQPPANGRSELTSSTSITFVPPSSVMP